MDGWILLLCNVSGEYLYEAKTSWPIHDGTLTIALMRKVCSESLLPYKLEWPFISYFLPLSRPCFALASSSFWLLLSSRVKLNDKTLMLFFSCPPFNTTQKKKLNPISMQPYTEKEVCTHRHQQRIKIHIHYYCWGLISALSDPLALQTFVLLCILSVLCQLCIHWDSPSQWCVCIYTLSRASVWFVHVPRSPSWTDCLAIINLCLKLKSHLRWCRACLHTYLHYCRSLWCSEEHTHIHNP